MYVYKSQGAMKMGYYVHCINEEISVRWVILTVDWDRNLSTISQVCIDTQFWTASWGMYPIACLRQNS